MSYWPLLSCLPLVLLSSLLLYHFLLALSSLSPHVQYGTSRYCKSPLWCTNLPTACASKALCIYHCEQDRRILFIGQKQNFNLHQNPPDKKSCRRGVTLHPVHLSLLGAVVPTFQQRYHNRLIPGSLAIHEMEMRQRQHEGRSASGLHKTAVALGFEHPESCIPLTAPQRRQVLVI